MILDMKEFQEFEKERLKKNVASLKNLGITTKLIILTDDEDKRTQSYMKSKLAMADELGIKALKCVVKNETEAIKAILNAIFDKTPIICQLPINKNILDLYNSKLELLSDVDGFNSLDYIFKDNYSNIPATPKGIMRHLSYIKYNLRGKTVVILGRGELVGKPLATLMINKGASVIVLNSKSNKQVREQILKLADVVICATGIKGSAKISELSSDKEVLVYNVGTCFENGKLTTELEIDEDKVNVKYTDRIKAVGVCTVLELMDNVVNHHENMLVK